MTSHILQLAPSLVVRRVWFGAWDSHHGAYSINKRSILLKDLAQLVLGRMLFLLDDVTGFVR